MTYQKLIQEVLRLKRQGLGRRRIANALNVTVWKVRRILNTQTTHKKISKAMPAEPKCSITKSKIVVSTDIRDPQPTSISIKAASELDDTPARLTVRGTSLKVANVSDIHWPYEDEKAEEIAKQFLREWKPDVMVFNGDLDDCYAISRFTKSPAHRMSIQEELDYGAKKRREWINHLPSIKHWYETSGNHETRLARLIAVKAPELASIRELTIPELLGLEEMGIQWVRDDQELQIGRLMFVHGHLIRKHSGVTARAHFEQYGCSVAVGHCHRLAVTYKRNKNGTHAMVEGGCLCDFDIEYAKYPDWQKGITTFEFDGDDFAVYQHPIVDNRLIVNGKVYLL